MVKVEKAQMPESLSAAAGKPSASVAARFRDAASFGTQVDDVRLLFYANANAASDRIMSLREEIGEDRLLLRRGNLLVLFGDKRNQKMTSFTQSCLPDPVPTPEPRTGGEDGGSGVGDDSTREDSGSGTDDDSTGTGGDTSPNEGSP